MRTRSFFTIALRYSCQHKRQAARLYRALAEHEPDAPHRALLLKLATYEEQRSRRHAMWLEQLGAAVPEERESLGGRWWRWVLVRCGVRCVLVWTERIERADRWFLVGPLARRTRGRWSQRTAAHVPNERGS